VGIATVIVIMVSGGIFALVAVFYAAVIIITSMGTSVIMQIVVMVAIVGFMSTVVMFIVFAFMTVAFIVDWCSVGDWGERRRGIGCMGKLHQFVMQDV